jgi:hypothetical protein
MLSYKITNLKTQSPKEYLSEPDLGSNKTGQVVLACIEADFEFWQAGECLFREPEWNVGGLAMQLATWLKTGVATDFEFDCIDSESRNLFTFQRSGSGFQFLSEWSELNNQKVIAREVLIRFIQAFIKEVAQRIKTDLGLDASFYLNG